MSEEGSGGPLTGPKVEPLTDAELVYVAQNHDAMGTNLLRATVGRLLATIADRDAQIAVLVEALTDAAKMIPELSGMIAEAECAEQENPSPHWAKVGGLKRDGYLASYREQFAQALSDLPTASKALLERLEGAKAAYASSRDFGAEWKARAEALQARISELSRTQRTPGTVEACIRRGWGCDNWNKGNWPECTTADCPIRTQEKSSQ